MKSRGVCEAVEVTRRLGGNMSISHVFISET